jgi:branched-chain amino acid transport system permease protein
MNDQTALQRMDLWLTNRLGRRTGWVLCIVGAVGVVVGALLPWTYTAEYPQDLTVALYPAGPQIYVLILAIAALLLLAGERIPAIGRVTGRVLRHGVGGTLRAIGFSTLILAVFVMAAIAWLLDGLVNIDPGGYLTLLGALLLAVGSRTQPMDGRLGTFARLPDWVEILIIAVVLALALYVVVIGFALDETQSFVAFCIFIAGAAFVAVRAGLAAWVSEVAGRHYAVTVAAAFVVAVVFPFTQGDNNRYLNVAANTVIFAVVAMGLNIVIGLAGLLDLGYIAFLGVGAYVGALLSGSGFSTIDWAPPFPVVLLLCALAAAIFGVVIGVPSIRTRGDYLAIVTLGFGEIFRLTMGNLDGQAGPDITNGPNGIPAIPNLKFFGWDFGKPLHLFGTELGYFANYYFLELLLLAFVIVVFTRSTNSRIGRGWVAIREDETAAAAMGINTFRLKVTAFVLGASLAGLAGGIKAHLSTSVDPSQYQFLESAFLVAAIVLGGMGTVTGVLLGAVVLKVLPEKLRFLDQYRLLVFGLVLVLMMRLRPEGLVPNARRAREFHEDELDTELAQEQVTAGLGPPTGNAPIARGEA